MENYINICGLQIELTAEQVKQLRGILGKADIRLSDIPVGETFKLGDHEMIVLEQSGDTTAVIRKELLVNSVVFGNNNRYEGSNADLECGKFADEIAAIVGAENLVEHTVDLTSDDGLKDYGKIRRRASLLTADLYRRYVEILDKHKIDRWWWLATPHSTKKHGNVSWAKCVAPSGRISDDVCSVGFGVRPFCILKSNIFVSK